MPAAAAAEPVGIEAIGQFAAALPRVIGARILRPVEGCNMSSLLINLLSELLGNRYRVQM